ncbi:1-acyl-sn-glycerol-3-phosphate acyltransferase [Bacillus sp. JRC01]|nr:1-acyl-sn-glycerol-3-phosphate acyltransferase [Bacillus sp. JRC01]
MYSFLANLAKLIFGKVEIRNTHLLPEEGGYIVTCSHKTWLDVVALGFSMPGPVHFMAKKELFDRRIPAFILHKIHAFPVNRENPSPSSIKKPVKLLRGGAIVGVFPGGTRSDEDVEAKRGAITIANLSRVPIVPAAYHGPTSFKELLRNRHKAVIVIGQPYTVRAKDKEQMTAETKVLSGKINDLIKEAQKIS